MPSVAKEADIVIVAAGRAGVVGADYVREGQTIIDVGINVNAEASFVVMLIMRQLSQSLMRSHRFLAE